MKKILAIAGTTLRLAFRSGAAPALALLAAGTGIGVFWAARGDGTIVPELQMRLRYGLYFVTGLVNFAVMYVGCVSLRRDLDRRHFHLMVAAPAHRAQVWLGKYLGLMLLGAGAFLFASLALAACCLVFALRRDQPDDRTALRDGFLRAWAVHRPEQPPLDDLVEREFRRRFAERQHDHDDDHHGEPEWVIKREMLKDIRRDLQMLAPDAAKTWRFHLDSARADGDAIRLRVKFYTENKRNLVRGAWELAAPGQPPAWSADFSGHPFMTHQLRIPRGSLPAGPTLELTFRGRGTPHLIFPISEADGIRLLSGQGGILGNYLRLLLVTTLHLGLLLALALALAAMFSYSVAVFVTIAAYFVSISADFFLGAMQFQLYGERGAWHALLRSALALGQGLKSPSAIDPFAQGFAIPLEELFGQWGAAAVATAAVIALAGIIVLTRKEIDKLLQS